MNPLPSIQQQAQIVTNLAFPARMAALEQAAADAFAALQGAEPDQITKAEREAQLAPGRPG